MDRSPLNGIKTHPLSIHALAVLQSLSTSPRPRQVINAGVANRLEREDLVELVQLPSPFKVHHGGHIPHLKITAAGLSVLTERGL